MDHTDVAKHRKPFSWPTGIVLDVLEGPDRGRRFELHLLRADPARGGRTTDVLLGGRGPHDIQLTDTEISDTHFRLEIASSGHIRLVDNRSTNGTWLNEARLEGAALLWPNAVFRLATSTVIRVSAILAEKVAPVDGFGQVLGTSKPMSVLFAALRRVARTPLPTLILGETGTGKGAIAKAMHEQSDRCQRPFYKFDCAGIPSELADGLLRGHARGAFSGAEHELSSPFEEADGGTLFLDEIGELPLELQQKFLRVLDDKEVQRVGEHRARKVDVRVIAGTNVDLNRAVEQGRFRADLFYRLGQLQFTVPRLRDRRQDVPLLARHFLDVADVEIGRRHWLSDRAIVDLQDREWPGNVRELRDVVEAAAWLAESPEIGPHDLDIHLEAAEQPNTGPVSEPIVVDTSIPLKAYMDRAERAYCTSVLTQAKGNVALASRLARSARQGFADRLKRLGISVKQFKG